MAHRAEIEADLARKERETARIQDPLEAHGIGEELLAPLLEALARDPRIRRAHLVRKQAVHLPESPVLLLVVVWQGPILDVRGRKRAAFQTELARSLPFPPGATSFVMVTTVSGFQRHRRRIEALGPAVFRRGG